MKENKYIHQVSRKSGVNEHDCVKVMDAMDNNAETKWKLPLIIGLNLVIISSFIYLVIRVRKVLHTIR